MPKRKAKPGTAVLTRLPARRVEAEKHTSNPHLVAAASQERERMRIGAELHDGVLQSLVRVKLDIEQLVAEIEGRPPRDVASDLSKIASDVRDCIREIRAVLSDLIPPHLEHTDIVEALHRCIDAFRDRYPAQVRRRLEPIRAKVAAEQKLGLFRILQEALSNVQKHADATRVQIELRTTARAVRLRVIDDGRGFDPSESEPRHYGLKNMRHRAAALGGFMIVQSAPGKGTIIVVKIPLPNGSKGGNT